MKKFLIITVLIFLFVNNAFAQISSPGLGKAKAASWFAVGFSKNLDTIKDGGWKSMTYLGLGRKSNPDNKNPFYKPAILVVNQEFYNFSEEMNNNSSFLGINEAFYFFTDKDLLKKTAKEVWVNNYDYKLLELELNNHLNRKITLDSDEEIIENYIYKIPLSMFYILLEELLEFISGFIIIFIISHIALAIILYKKIFRENWQRFTKRREEMIVNKIIKIISITSIIWTIIFFFFSFLWGDIAEENIKKNIKEEIKEEIINKI